MQRNLSEVDLECERAASGRRGVRFSNPLPFISIAVSPKDREREVARELVIRLRDRRVLSSQECCNGCIDSALASLQEVRQILVEKQVALSDLQDGPLFLMIDMMRQGIRQFLTYTERLSDLGDDPTPGLPADFRRLPEARQAYFDALELLRGRCLTQIAAIGGMEAPQEGLIVQYQNAWRVEAYVAPPALAAPTTGEE
ncbi:hypothetical protein [Brevundimonas aurantiaca]|uniref:hypothetical protein n=1 Tax=Brevundimonas aurantiaca TaxID=74316 RepID=UPI0030178B04